MMHSKLFALAVLLTVSLEAESTPGKPTFQDVISNPKYLSEAMGAKVLLITDKKTGEVSADLQKAIKQAKLDEGRQFYPLPKEATQPVAKVRGAPQYPPQLRRNRISGSARYLFFIGADGAIKGIYCYESTHPEFAVAGAAAIVKWRYSPPVIENTPVPVLVSQLLDFNTD